MQERKTYSFGAISLEEKSLSSNGKSNLKKVQRASNSLKMRNSVLDFHLKILLMFMKTAISTNQKLQLSQILKLLERNKIKMILKKLRVSGLMVLNLFHLL